MQPRRNRHVPSQITARMLFVLIPIAWLSLIAICWAACGMAQRGDAQPRPRSSGDQSDTPSDTELGVWEELLEPTIRDTRRASTAVH
jgi:hypothetical protein